MAYAVIGGKNKEISNRYAVVGGVHKKIEKRYVVDSGVYKLLWSSGLDYLFTGAAYFAAGEFLKRDWTGSTFDGRAYTVESPFTSTWTEVCREGSAISDDGRILITYSSSYHNDYLRFFQYNEAADTYDMLASFIPSEILTISKSVMQCLGADAYISHEDDGSVFVAIPLCYVYGSSSTSYTSNYEDLYDVLPGTEGTGEHVYMMKFKIKDGVVDFYQIQYLGILSVMDQNNVYIAFGFSFDRDGNGVCASCQNGGYGNPYFIFYDKETDTFSAEINEDYRKANMWKWTHITEDGYALIYNAIYKVENGAYTLIYTLSNSASGIFKHPYMDNIYYVTRRTGDTICCSIVGTTVTELGTFAGATCDILRVHDLSPSGYALMTLYENSTTYQTDEGFGIHKLSIDSSGIITADTLIRLVNQYEQAGWISVNKKFINRDEI